MSRFEIILTDTRHAGNIGAVARVMKNLGFSRLTLVNPTARAHAEAVRMAVGAEAVIEKARIVDTLREAVEPLAVAAAVTRRGRRVRRETFTPRQAAGRLGGAEGGAGLVFGSEKFGLSNEQARMCSFFISIQTAPESPSLNLAQAVTIVLYEISLGRLGGEQARRYTRSLADVSERNVLYKRIEETLTCAGFFKNANPDRTLWQIRDIFNRAELDGKDVRLLLGVFKQIKRSISGRA